MSESEETDGGGWPLVTPTTLYIYPYGTRRIDEMNKKLLFMYIQLVEKVRRNVYPNFQKDYVDFFHKVILKRQKRHCIL